VALYLWLKALHIIFMVAWFAGLFYIFRLYVYHIQNFDDPNQRQTFETMERKLLYVIMYPAMILTLLFGFLMVAMAPSILAMPWFQIKLAGVFGLMAYHFYATGIHNRLREGQRPLSEKACRIINEVPTVLLILIIIMVVIKPGG
jgi:putative membrane protein